MVNVDMRLLQVFLTLMDERNASQAAQKMQITGAAITYTLRRLREIFGDQLFTRLPHGMKPTPRALELEPPLRAMLSMWESVEKAETAAQGKRGWSTGKSRPVAGATQAGAPQ